MSSPIRPGSIECPWPPRYTIWNAWPMTKPKTDGTYIIYNGHRHERARYKDGEWLEHSPGFRVTGWREQTIDEEAVNYAKNI